MIESESRSSQLGAVSCVAARLIRNLLVVLSCMLACTQAHAFDDDYKQSINGTVLHFRVRGEDKSNPYLLILHGGPGLSPYVFYSWGASLERQLNVVYLDQRGSGQSQHLTFAKPDAPTQDEVKDYTIGNLINDIEGVREFLKLERWYVLGHSWGGMLGLEYVVAHPEHVLGFIIMDGLVSQPLTQDAMLDTLQPILEKQRASSKQNAEAAFYLEEIEQFRLLPPGNARMNGVFGLIMKNYSDIYFAHDDAASISQKSVMDTIKKYGVPISALITNEPTAALSITEKYGSRDDTSLLPKVTAPTLVINGKQDGLITPYLARATKTGIKGSQLLILDQCGHFPFIEQPVRTTAAILSFAKSHPPQTK